MLRKMSVSLLLCALLTAAACQPGDEAPPEDNLTILGQSITEILNLAAIAGNYWEGVSGFEDCTYTPLDVTTFAGCSVLEDTQATVDSNVAKNTIVILDQQGNALTGRMILAVPHFNLGVNTYTIGVTGSLARGSDQSYEVVSLSQSSSTANVAGAGLSAALTEFRAEIQNKKLVGIMKVRLTQSGRADSAVLTYGFSLDKAF